MSQPLPNRFVEIKSQPCSRNKDSHFPQFRSFDWFDLHSWSRGVIPSADGKDQESTSEELNLLPHGFVFSVGLVLDFSFGGWLMVFGGFSWEVYI